MFICCCTLSAQLFVVLRSAASPSHRKSPSSNKCLQNETRFKHFCFVFLASLFAWINGNETSKVQSSEEINILLWKVLRDTISFWLLFLLAACLFVSSFARLRRVKPWREEKASERRKICNFLFCAINKLIKCNIAKRDRERKSFPFVFVNIWSRSLAYSLASSRLICH